MNHFFQTTRQTKNVRAYRTKRFSLNSDLSVAPIDGSPGLLVVRAVFFYPFSERVCLRVRSRLLLLSYYGMPADFFVLLA